MVHKRKHFGPFQVSYAKYRKRVCYGHRLRSVLICHLEKENQVIKE